MAEVAIVEALSGLPPNASAEQKKAAVQAAYPFGPREHHPYRVWSKAVREMLGKRKRGVLDGWPPATDQLTAFIYALAADPLDKTKRLVLADYLEECGDPLAAFVREPILFPDDVAREAWFIANGRYPNKSAIHGDRWAKLVRRLVQDRTAGCLPMSDFDYVNRANARFVISMFGYDFNMLGRLIECDRKAARH